MSALQAEAYADGMKKGAILQSLDMEHIDWSKVRETIDNPNRNRLEAKVDELMNEIDSLEE